MFCRFLACFAFAWPLASTAQTLSAAPQSADSNVAVPAVRYDSAFVGYRRYEPPQLAPWRVLNDQVGKTGTSGPAQPAAGDPASSGAKATELNVRKPTSQSHQH
jgi:hypothetical protein